ncbi:hypothetical protein FRX31_009710 [Thalictrum thalictroides]|uniref:Uncharacterized protein n=1 Tax=Thalictrum thalictroides TaxID=46969 RepID=A0A7J6WTH2_THATH|nr:hypothetical protein FRX31_009710 [Thalictrum thalictroides]
MKQEGMFTDARQIRTRTPGKHKLTANKVGKGKKAAAKVVSTGSGTSKKAAAKDVASGSGSYQARRLLQGTYQVDLQKGRTKLGLSLVDQDLEKGRKLCLKKRSKFVAVRTWKGLDQ